MISTKGRYALAYLTDLALYAGEKPLSVKDSAAHCGISEKYLEQIVGTLAKNKIIRSVRGAHGGYLFYTPPEKCTVGKVLRIMEGGLCVAPCLEDSRCESKEDYSNIILWRKMDEALSTVVDNITIADMCEWKKDNIVF
jgi:Rrf2 family protein